MASRMLAGSAPFTHQMLRPSPQSKSSMKSAGKRRGGSWQSSTYSREWNIPW